MVDQMADEDHSFFFLERVVLGYHALRKLLCDYTTLLSPFLAVWQQSERFVVVYPLKPRSGVSSKDRTVEEYSQVACHHL